MCVQIERERERERCVWVYRAARRDYARVVDLASQGHTQMKSCYFIPARSFTKMKLWMVTRRLRSGKSIEDIAKKTLPLSCQLPRSKVVLLSLLFPSCPSVGHSDWHGNHQRWACHSVTQHVGSTDRQLHQMKSSSKLSAEGHWLLIHRAANGNSLSPSWGVICPVTDKGIVERQFCVLGSWWITVSALMAWTTLARLAPEEH